MNHEDEIRHYQFLQDAMHLIEDLEHGDRMPEALRARLHALTRKVTMSDEDLERLSDELCPRGRGGEITDLIRDIRDRYEERGKYAPAAPVAESGTNES